MLPLTIFRRKNRYISFINPTKTFMWNFLFFNNTQIFYKQNNNINLSWIITWKPWQLSNSFPYFMIMLMNVQICPRKVLWCMHPSAGILVRVFNHVRWLLLFKRRYFKNISIAHQNRTVHFQMGQRCWRVKLCTQCMGFSKYMHVRKCFQKCFFIKVFIKVLKRRR